MTDASIMAPVRIVGMSVPNASLSVGAPADSMRQGFNVTFDTGDVEEDEEHGEYSLAVTMGVKVRLTDAKDDQDVRAEASVQVEAMLAVAMIPGLNDRGKALGYLKRNGASITYAHARSYLMTITAMSPTGALIIPPILPDNLVNPHDGHGGEDMDEVPAR